MFKKGDRVRCVDASGVGGKKLSAGLVYTVDAVVISEVYETLLRLREIPGENEFFARRFVPADAPSITFRVINQVEVSADGGGTWTRVPKAEEIT